MSAQPGYLVDLPRNPGTITEGALVVARAWKYDSSPHWVVPGYYLGHDQYGHWIHQPAGVLVARPGTAHLAASNALCLIPHSGQWIATLYADALEDFDVYIDLSSSIGWQEMKRGAWEINSIDMDLDVIRSRSRGVFLDDEDEFAEHQTSMNYPASLVRSIGREAGLLLSAVVGNDAPFNVEHRATWNRKAERLAAQLVEASKNLDN